MAKSKKIDKDMGFRLKKARLDQKLTYDELSEMSGVSSRYIKELKLPTPFGVMNPEKSIL